MDRQVLLLASGGLDSTTLAYKLIGDGLRVVPMFLDYGQHCVEIEWARLNEVLPPGISEAQRFDISDLFADSNSRLIREADLWNEVVEDDDLYVPYRTMLFFTAAAVRAQTVGILEVYTGFINSNHAKEIDCATEYMNQLDRLVSSIGPVRFHSPFRTYTKAQVAQLAVKLGVPIGRTYSCQASATFPCGACPNCVERLHALRKANLV